jgi:chloride channel 2
MINLNICLEMNKQANTGYNLITRQRIDPSKPSQRHNYNITDFFWNYEEISKIPGPKERLVSHEDGGEEESKSWTNAISDYFMMSNPSHWIFLILMALITTIIAIGVEFVVKYVNNFKSTWWVNSDLPYMYQFAIWVSLALFLTLIATSVGEYISKDAEGSGIPEMKSILAGVNIYRYLSFQTLIGKIIGLTAALSAGLSVGKEGPFVHLAGGVTNKLWKLSYFKDIQNNHSLKKQMLAAAVAAGVTATFGAPIGGVLFSIEVTSTYYFVSNLWKAFFWACVAMVWLKTFSTFGLFELVINSEPMEVGHGREYIYYGLLGLCCGILGSIFIQVLTKLIWLRTKIKAPFISDRWKLCTLIGLLTGIWTFCITFLKTPERQLLNQFFSQKSLDSFESTQWGQPSVGFNLLIFVIIKFILEVIAISWPIPAGVFTPTFVLGAGFGRLYGYVLRQLVGPSINEAAYAIIGAAWVTSSVTRTISVAMIVFELNGELSYMIPVLFAVLISYAISNSLAMSIFDVLLDMKDIPYLPALRSVGHYHLKANDIMNKNFLYLTKNSQLSDIIVLLQHLGPRAKSIPVVESEEDKLLLYSVQAQSMRKYLFSYYNAISHTLEKETRDRLNKYLYNLYAISSNKMKEFSKNRKEKEQDVLSFLNPSSNVNASRHGDEEGKFSSVYTI